MGLGVVVSGGGAHDAAAAAQAAERAGLDSVWATEFYDRSATIGLAAMAQATQTIALGSAIMYAFGRTPLRERLQDILKEAMNLNRYIDHRHLKEEAGDLLCSVLELFTECEWDAGPVIAEHQVRLAVSSSRVGPERAVSRANGTVPLTRRAVASRCSRGSGRRA